MNEAKILVPIKLKMKFNAFKLAKVVLALILISQISAAEDRQMFRYNLEHTGETPDVIENPEYLEFSVYLPQHLNFHLKRANI